MDDMLEAIFSGFVRWRSIRYLSTTQAVFATVSGYLRAGDSSVLRAVSSLEGGGLGEGSTCGLVSGGCITLVAGHLADLVADRGKGEALYARMREYTSWFEDSFGSTLCSPLGHHSSNGKTYRGCIQRASSATVKLVELVDLPLQRNQRAGDVDKRLAAQGGYCAAEVLKSIRAETGCGSLYLEQLSIALDGGVGLSGGLCGALAGGLLPLGILWGLNPRVTSFGETIAHFLRGRPQLQALGKPLIDEFRQNFGSLECADLIGRSFQCGSELADHMSRSSTCGEIKNWCQREILELIASRALFD